ncbi:MAG: hypothetical protein GPOALKHO_000952 [Sodalis sp.]|nr:MAG: hypothetical protein GPOALKHO_000952 [Sodalis sp.]
MHNYDDFRREWWQYLGAMTRGDGLPRCWPMGCAMSGEYYYLQLFSRQLPGFYLCHRTGDLMVRATNDVDRTARFSPLARSADVGDEFANQLATDAVGAVADAEALSVAQVQAAFSSLNNQARNI